MVIKAAGRIKERRRLVENTSFNAITSTWRDERRVSSLPGRMVVVSDVSVVGDDDANDCDDDDVDDVDDDDDDDVVGVVYTPRMASLL